MVTLIVECRGHRQVFTFQTDAISIGREEENDLRIGSRFVSSKHCRIEPTGQGFKVVDLGSQNGIAVNGAETSQCRLNAGDRVNIGPAVVWFQTAPDTPAPVPELAKTSLDVEPDVLVSAKDGAQRDALGLRERLEALLIEFRRAFGDERGLEEIEQAVTERTANLFPRPAFAHADEAWRLIEITRALNSTLETPKLLALILDSAIEMTSSERGFILLRGDDGSWTVRLARNFDHEAIKGADQKISHGIAEQVAASGETVVSVDALEDRRFEAYASVNQLKLRSIMCVPLRARDAVIGTLYLDNRFKNGIYGEHEQNLLETFADQAAIALENARLIETSSSLSARATELETLAKDLDSRVRGSLEAGPDERKPATRDGLRFRYDRIIGQSPVLFEIFHVLERVIESDLPVLITGESGTGKELIARAIHENSARKDKAFVRENCAAIPENLLESELFGHRRGSFTGAFSDKRGLFEEADGGTILLDEIGEMSIGMQAKLMRVLQDGEIRAVGARASQRVNARVISATNRDLRKRVADGAFREDLFFRLNVVTISMPPLRERLEDVPLLAEEFLRQAAEKTGQPKKTIDAVALRHLMHYHWPGNIRELQNEIQRACALSGAIVKASDLSPEVTASRQLPAEPIRPGGLKELSRLAQGQKERELILQALEQCNWRKSAASRRLGISRPTLDQKIRLHSLTPYIERGRRR